MIGTERQIGDQRKAGIEESKTTRELSADGRRKDADASMVQRKLMWSKSTGSKRGAVAMSRKGLFLISVLAAGGVVAGVSVACVQEPCANQQVFEGSNGSMAISSFGAINLELREIVRDFEIKDDAEIALIVNGNLLGGGKLDGGDVVSVVVIKRGDGNSHQRYTRGSTIAGSAIPADDSHHVKRRFQRYYGFGGEQSAGRS